MLKQRLTLSLLVLLAFLQGFVPLLHAHAGISSPGEPHFHLGSNSPSDRTLLAEGRELRVPGTTVIVAAEGLSRDGALAVADLPAVLADPFSRPASPLAGETNRPHVAALPRPAAAFSHPPPQAPPAVA